MICYVCGKEPLSKDEIGLTKKIINKKTSVFYCLHCLAETLEETEETLQSMIEFYKNKNCPDFEKS